MFERLLPDADRELEGDIYEFFLASYLSQFLWVCRDDDEIERVDSLYHVIEDELTQLEIIQLLKHQRDRKVEMVTKDN